MPDRMQFHRAILDHLTEPVLACDATGLVQYMNPVAERMTGWPLWEAVNRPVEDILDAEGKWSGPGFPELLHSGECLLQQPCSFAARWGDLLTRRLNVSPLYQGAFRCGTVFVFSEDPGA
jgi:PAS domain S-box-containing protein